MIRRPARINRSINEHNSDLLVTADWLETSVLVDGAPISRSDFCDCLEEEFIYEDQGFALDWAGQVWGELRLRMDTIGINYPFDVQNQSISRMDGELTDYDFCLGVSLCHFCDWIPWNQTTGSIFEELVERRVTGFAGGWSVEASGFKQSKPVDIRSVADQVASAVQGSVNEAKLVVHHGLKDGGLDLFLVRKYADRRGCFPTVFMQCASGENWRSKTHEPDVEFWGRMINFCYPVRGFATPRCLAEKEFRASSDKVRGVLLDRYRLLSDSTQSSGHNPTSDEMKQWLETHIKAIRGE